MGTPHEYHRPGPSLTEEVNIMIIATREPTSYADFKLLVSNFGLRDIFWGSISRGRWVAYAFRRDDPLCVQTALLPSAPASFATDFPHAIKLGTPIGVV